MNSKANDAFMAKLAVQNSKRIDQLTNLIGSINLNVIKTCDLNGTITKTDSGETTTFNLTGTVPTTENCKHFLGLRTMDRASDATYSTFYLFNAENNIDGFGCSYNSTSIVLDANYLNNDGNSAGTAFCQAVSSDFDTSELTAGNSVSGTIHFDFI